MTHMKETKLSLFEDKRLTVQYSDHDSHKRSRLLRTLWLPSMILLLLGVFIPLAFLVSAIPFLVDFMNSWEGWGLLVSVSVLGISFLIINPVVKFTDERIKLIESDERIAAQDNFQEVLRNAGYSVPSHASIDNCHRIIYTDIKTGIEYRSAAGGHNRETLKLLLVTK